MIDGFDTLACALMGAFLAFSAHFGLTILL